MDGKCFTADTGRGGGEDSEGKDRCSPELVLFWFTYSAELKHLAVKLKSHIAPLKGEFDSEANCYRAALYLPF